MNPPRSTARTILAVLVIVLLAPLGLIAALVAALLLADQLLSGWLPGRWFSSSAADWVFGAGTAGSARNYVGFMAAGVLAAACMNGVKRALGVLRRA